MESNFWIVLALGISIGAVIGFLACAAMVIRKVRSGFDITLVNNEIEFKARD